MPEIERQNHWGEWLASRARFVGFRSWVNLAAAIGCTQERITQWTHAQTPPIKMRKGFDAALCSVLKTDACTLFNRYVDVSPKEAPLIDASSAMDDVPLRAEIFAAAESLKGPELRALGATARALRATAAA